MNILLLNWRDPKNPKSGGAEIVTLKHASAWVKSGHTVTWFASRFADASNEEIISGVKIIRSGSSFGVYLRAPFYYFHNKKNIDIVVDEIHGIPFFTPLYVRKPILAFIHEVAGEIWDYMYPIPINIVGKFFENFYFRFYKNVKFWTDAESTIGELVKHGIPKKNCIAIPCPADNLPLTALPTKASNPTYIFVSRLVKMKGVEDVIIAFAFIQKKQPNATLWIVGDGDTHYIAHLYTLVSQMHLDAAVRFYGKVSQLKKLQLMRKAHILLHASVKEGWGLVVVEAASQATPSVVYDVAGLRDIIKQSKCGVKIQKNIPEELARQAVLLQRDKKNYVTYQRNGLDYAKSLRWEKVVKQSLSLIKSL